MDICKINAKCGNGFELNYNHYITHNEKVFDKRIDMGEDEFLHIEVAYYNGKNGNTPYVLAEYEKLASSSESCVFYSSHSGNWRKKYFIPELMQTRKNVGILQKITTYMSAEFIDKLKYEYEVAKQCGELKCEEDLMTATIKERLRNEEISIKDLKGGC